MPHQSDLRCAFDLIGSEAHDVFEVIKFELREAQFEACLLSNEPACANPAEDFGQVLVRGARQTQRDYTYKPPSYAHQNSRDGQDLAFQRGRYERYDAADWKDIFGSLPQAANYS